MVNIMQKNFLYTWKAVCEKNRKDLSNSWYYAKRDYTNHILINDNNIIMQVANALNLEVFQEYYSIDAVFYEKESDVVNNEAKNETWTNTRGLWLKHIQIAFEHENELYGSSGGYQEMCHLLTINSDLKVLVGYAGKDFCDKVAEDFQSIMSNINDASQSILLILGYLDGDNIQWIGYNVTKNSFNRVEKKFI